MDKKKEKELHELIKNAIEPALKKARMIGVNIGWQGAMLGVAEKLKEFKTVNEAIEYYKAEADKIRNKMNIPEIQ